MVKHLHDYTVVTYPDDNGTFVSLVPAIEGCHAWGQSAAESRSELEFVFEMMQEEYAEEGWELPEDVALALAHAS